MGTVDRCPLPLARRPGHAFLYGSSLRVGARRDLFLDASKDPAVALYDRAVAMRVAERSDASADFLTLTLERVRELTRRYNLDYLITEAVCRCQRPKCAI